MAGYFTDVMRRSLVSVLPTTLGRYLEPFPEYYTEAYPFGHPDTEENLMLVAKEGRMQTWSAGVTIDVPAIRAATNLKLIERLTYHAYPDPELVDTFLLTYRSLSSPKEVLTLLIRRFYIRVTDASTPLEKEQAKTIQSRVLNVLKTWIKNYWMDFDSPEMIELLNRFVGEKLAHAEEHAEAAKWLGELIVKQQKEWRDRQIPLLSMRFELPPNVQLDALVDRIINQIPPAEFAEQLTLMQSELFQDIPQYEFLAKVWKKASRNPDHPNLDKMIESFNNTSGWIVVAICSLRKPEERGKAFKYFIKMAKRFKQLNNFDGVICTVSAFESAALHRLAKSWETVSSKKVKRYEELKALMSHSSSFKAYRAALHECKPPCIPYIGLSLTDLTFICDGNEDWFKRRKPAERQASGPGLLTPTGSSTPGSHPGTPLAGAAPPGTPISPAVAAAPPMVPGSFPTARSSPAILAPSHSPLVASPTLTANAAAAAAHPPLTSSSSSPGPLVAAAPVAATQPEAERLVNFEKRRMFARAVAEVRQYQQERYADLQTNNAIQQAILQAHAMAKRFNEQQLYQLSLEREPREKKEHH